MSFPSGPGCTHSLVAARDDAIVPNATNSAIHRIEMLIDFTIPATLAFGHSRGTLTARLGFMEESHVTAHPRAGRTPAILGYCLPLRARQHRHVDRVRSLGSPADRPAARRAIFAWRGRDG